MSIYASTFITGLQEPVSRALLQQIPDARINSLYDGLVVYTTSVSARRISSIRYFNNSFIVLKRFEYQQSGPVEMGNNPFKAQSNPMQSYPIEYMLHKTHGIRDSLSKINKEILLDKKTFRIVTSNQNRLTAVNTGLLSKAENIISKTLGLAVNRVRPDIEFWFLYRSEKTGFFMLRITKHASCEKSLNKGELRPELSCILNFISEPEPCDVFIDPFCGYGSIVTARFSLAPAGMLFACDMDAGKVTSCKRRTGECKKGAPVVTEKIDALDMKQFEDGFFDRIVTDPPWGFYGNIAVDINCFYRRMIAEFYRVLKANGIMVILTARKEELEEALMQFKSKLELHNKYDILVSGKKAAVYKIIKKTVI